MILIYRHAENCCDLIFSWDTEKAAENRRKKGRPSFEVASYVFDDPTALTRFNRSKDNEDREETLGKESHTIYYVVHTIKVIENVETIRIISARKANAREKAAYTWRYQA